jgi:hypothetical protein
MGSDWSRANDDQAHHAPHSRHRSGHRANIPAPAKDSVRYQSDIVDAGNSSRCWPVPVLVVRSFTLYLSACRLGQARIPFLRVWLFVLVAQYHKTLRGRSSTEPMRKLKHLS